MSDFAEKNEKLAQELVRGYRKIEEGVVVGYRAIEDGVVNGYRKIEEGVTSGFGRVTDRFVETFFTRSGESVEEAKERLASGGGK